jgi:SAM-dependent methyltransferase
MVQERIDPGVTPGAFAEKLAGSRIFGRSPLGAYLRFSEWIWRRLPRSVASSPPALLYGRSMHGLVRLHGDRRQFFGTFFFRNRPQLELIGRLAYERVSDKGVRMAVLGCSLGAEVYSIRWSLHSAHPELRPLITAVDISSDALDVGRKGLYSPGVSDLAQEPIFVRTTDAELHGMFDAEGTLLRVKPWLKEGIHWRLADARNPQIVQALGRHDIVVANDFLCHMSPRQAESCLRNIARLVSPGGYLVVSGVDLDVRTKVARALSWRPLTDSIEEIHEGDRSLRLSWPWRYWGLEPFDRSRSDRATRYASVFELLGGSEVTQ